MISSRPKAESCLYAGEPHICVFRPVSSRRLQPLVSRHPTCTTDSPSSAQTRFVPTSVNGTARSLSWTPVSLLRPHPSRQIRWAPLGPGHTALHRHRRHPSAGDQPSLSHGLYHLLGFKACSCNYSLAPVTSTSPPPLIHFPSAHKHALVLLILEGRRRPPWTPQTFPCVTFF